MPFQIQNNTAYRELVLDVLRQQAATPGTDTYELLRSNPGYNSYGGLKYDDAIHDNLKRAQGCYDILEEVLWYCYRYMPLHFNAFQRMMQIEEEHAADLRYGDTFRKKVFNTDGDLLVADIGCGPMTAGLALADWYLSKEHKPLKLSYVGVDASEHCRKFAERFANRHELFAMQNPPIFGAECSEVDVNELKNYVTQNGTLLFIFSYVFGQDSCNEEHMEKWALFVRQVMTTCNAKHNLVAYINSPPYPDRENSGQYIDPNAKYAQFCQLLGWRDQELKYRTGTDYKYPQSFLDGFNEPNGIISNCSKMC